MAKSTTQITWQDRLNLEDKLGRLTKRELIEQAQMLQINFRKVYQESLSPRYALITAIINRLETRAGVLCKLQELTGGTIRLSRCGVPHLLIEKDGVMRSVCYFGKLARFRMFWPYPALRQERLDLPDLRSVAFYFQADEASFTW